MRWVLLGFLAALAGCGYKGEEFISDTTELYCTLAVDCYNPAILTFYGWDSVQACMDDRGPEVTAAGQGCTYDAKAARACRDAMEVAICPAEGEDIELPASCADVYTGCPEDEDTGGNGL